MFRHILVALDGSEGSARSLPWTRMLGRDREISLIRVIRTLYGVEPFPAELDAQMKERAREYLVRVATTFRPEARRLISTGPPAAMILNAAEEIGADLIVVSTRGGVCSAGRWRH